ncbi:MAG: 30S ribosomal protein S3 [Candidatus Aenigmatarchaeota archaeon]|nr:MAG: 30S ribosomal protein S3 [Candidatus Aenigmarchaeota archaeon]
MSFNKYFVKQSIKEVSIDDFIRQNFPTTDYSDIELQRTPLGIKIVIYTHKPGRVIGRSGSKINKMSDILKEKFELDNPQLDVKSIANPNLDANIVAKQIKTALERGYNYKKIGNLSMKKIMDAGAVGVEIVISGKLGGSKGRVGKFTGGYIKHCGNTAEELVDYGFEEANTKPGKIGIKVKIMKEFRDITGATVKKEPEKEEEKAGKRVAPEERDSVMEGGSLDFDYSEDDSEPAQPGKSQPKEGAAEPSPQVKQKAGKKETHKSEESKK